MKERAIERWENEGGEIPPPLARRDEFLAAGKGAEHETGIATQQFRVRPGDKVKLDQI